MEHRHPLLATTPTAEALSAIASAPTSVNVIAAPTNQGHQVEQSTVKQKRKRNRAVLSCQPCHDRKQQCDRAEPCKRCITRGTQSECKYDKHAQRPNRIRFSTDDSDHLSHRVAQLENVVQSSMRNMEPTALVGLEALLQLVQASNIVVGAATNSAGENVDRGLPTDQTSAVQVAAAALGQLSQQTVSNDSHNTNVLGHMTEILHHIRSRGTPVQGFDALADLRSHFPNHAITGHLLFYYFNESSIPWLWAVVHKPIFDNCYLTFSSGPHPPSLDFIALLAMVCASSLQFLPETQNNLFMDYEPGRNVLKKRLYEFSRSILLLNDAISSSVERVEALILLAIYQLNEGNLTAYYSSTSAAIRMAQSIFMNRDGSATWKSNILEVELRRRLWWTLFILDRFQCFMLRRPYLIHEQHCDVLLPQNLDQLELQEDTNLKSRPLNDLTQYTFHILQIHWAKLIGRIWDKCYAVQTPSYEAILSLEDDIRAFELEIPASFSSQTMQSALERPYLPFQTRVLTLQICHARATLFRQFLFASQAPVHQKHADFHQQAKIICLVFCKRFLAWQLLLQNEVDSSQLCWSEFAVRIFDIALMIAATVISDPANTQNEELITWLGLAQSLLRDMGACNLVAHNAVQCLDIVQRRTQVMLQHGLDGTNTVSTITDMSQHLARATQILALPQPSISNLLSLQDRTDPLWHSETPIAYTPQFPGVELLCGSSDPDALQTFLENCIPTDT